MGKRFIHQNSAEGSKRGSSPAVPSGPIETTKRAIIKSLRRAFVNSEDSFLRRVGENVKMEYPLEETDYPGIWVGFSFSKIEFASINPEHFETKSDGAKARYMLGKFEGPISLTVLSLSSLERDRISDALTQTILFGREHDVASSFFDELTYNDYVNITVQNSSLRPSGQNTTFGTPWSTEQMVYEDVYNFQILGQFATRFDSYGLVNLREVRIIPTDVTLSEYTGGGPPGERQPGSPPALGEWL